MNINFDDIITKANERKEKLKGIQEYSREIENRTDDLLFAMMYFDDLSRFVSDLDVEGRNMVPGATRMHYIGSWARTEYAKLVNGPENFNIRALVGDVK